MMEAINLINDAIDDMQKAKGIHLSPTSRKEIFDLIVKELNTTRDMPIKKKEPMTPSSKVADKVFSLRNLFSPVFARRG